MNLPSHLSVRNGHLFIGENDTVALAAEYGTPLYVTDEERVRARYREYRLYAVPLSTYWFGL